MINPYKVKKNYKAQVSINSLSNDETSKKTI